MFFIENSISSLLKVALLLQGANASVAIPEDAASQWGIEGMRSQQFSVGIFIFLIICIFVFAAIVVKFMRSGRGNSLKTGEKIMFVWIFIGIVAAIIMAVTQIFYGRLI